MASHLLIRLQMQAHWLLLAATVATACADDAHDEDSALFEQAYEEAADERSDASMCSGVRVPDQGTFGKRVALTFDDGPNPETTPRVLEVLRRHNVPAAFFINSSRTVTPAGAELAKQIAADPLFLLANHSHSHKNLAALSAAEVASQIDRGTRALEAAGEPARYFRFPYGSSTCATASAVRERGYIVSGWHVDSADWCYGRNNGECRRSVFQHVPDAMRHDMNAYVMSQVQRRQGGIVLFHDIQAITAAKLDSIVTALKAGGYTFVGLDDMSVFPRLHGGATSTAWIGDSCTADSQCNFDGGFCLRQGTFGVCTQACTTSCPDRHGQPTTRCVALSDPDRPSNLLPLCAEDCTQSTCATGLHCGEQRRASNAAQTATVCWLP